MVDPQKIEAPKVNNPRVFLDPSRARFADLYKYTSLDEIKIRHSFTNYKKSIGYLGN